MATHRSDDLMHFPKLDPSPTGEKTAERSRIRQDVDAFLAGGGQVTELGEQSGVQYPTHQNKKMLVDFLKRRSFRNNKKR